AALARRAASIRNNSSRWFSAGGLVGWMMNTSRPRTFSSILTKISPSAKRRIVTAHSGCPKCSAISSASGRLAVPARSNSWRRDPRGRDVLQPSEVAGDGGRIGCLPVQRPALAGPRQGIAVRPAHHVQRDDAVGLERGDPLVTPAVHGPIHGGGEATEPEIDMCVARAAGVHALEVGGARPNDELEQRLPAAAQAQPPTG